VIVDTSAVVSVVLAEADDAELRAALHAADHLQMSAGSYLEAGIVIDSKHDPATSRMLDALLGTLDVEIMPVTSDQARIARQAYRDYGKRSGHPARLNFGDCFAYALAIDTDEALLFKGDDFGHTDVRRAVR
jgi:ribonuclease VapC